MKIKKVKYILVAIVFLLFLLLYAFINLKNNNNLKKVNDTISPEFSKKLENSQDRINKLDDSMSDLSRRLDELKSYLVGVEQTVNELKNQTPEGKDNSVKIIINLYEIRRLGLDGGDFSRNLSNLERLTVGDTRLHDEVVELFKYKDNLITDSEIRNMLFTEYSKIDLKFAEGGNSKLKKIFMNNVKVIKIEDLKNNTEFVTKADELISLHRYGDLIVMIKNNYSDTQFPETINMLTNKIEFERVLDTILEMLYIRN